MKTAAKLIETKPSSLPPIVGASGVIAQKGGKVKGNKRTMGNKKVSFYDGGDIPTVLINFKGKINEPSAAGGSIFVSD
jgi:hypothetical protein